MSEQEKREFVVEFEVMVTASSEEEAARLALADLRDRQLGDDWNGKVREVSEGDKDYVVASARSVETDERFWDCECGTHYIHAKGIDDGCALCGAVAEEMPDSRVAEIGIGGKFSTDEDWLVAYNMSEYYDSLDDFDTRKVSGT